MDISTRSKCPISFQAVTSAALLMGVSLWSPSAHAADLVCSQGYTVIQCEDGTQFGCYLSDGTQVDCTESLAANTSACDAHGGLSGFVEDGLTQAEFGFECRIDDAPSGGAETSANKPEIKYANGNITSGDLTKTNEQGGKSVRPDPNFVKPCEVKRECVSAFATPTKQSLNTFQTSCADDDAILLVGAFPEIPAEFITVHNAGLAHNAILDEIADVARDIVGRGGTLDEKTKRSVIQWVAKKYDQKLLSMTPSYSRNLLERSHLTVYEQLDLAEEECPSNVSPSFRDEACDPVVFDMLRAFLSKTEGQTDQDVLDAAIDELRTDAESVLKGNSRNAVLGAASVFEWSTRYWSANGSSVDDLADELVGAGPWVKDGASFATTVLTQVGNPLAYTPVGAAVTLLGSAVIGAATSIWG